MQDDGSALQLPVPMSDGSGQISESSGWSPSKTHEPPAHPALHAPSSGNSSIQSSINGSIDSSIQTENFRRGTASLFEADRTPMGNFQEASEDGERHHSKNQTDHQYNNQYNEDASIEDASYATIQRIPLPNELPPPPRLASLPPQILHSGTVETLIGQNEDLMARLKVNLRRNAILEQQIIKLEKHASDLRHANDGLQDQARIVLEKAKGWQKKSEKLETRLYESENANESIKSNEQTKLSHWVEQVKKAKSESATQIATRDVQIRELRTRIEELSNHLGSRERAWQTDQAFLVDKYEIQLKQLSERQVQLDADLLFFKDRAQKIDDATQKQVEAENRAILFERKTKELEKKINTEVHELQTLTAQYRGEAKALASELESLRTETTRTRQDAEAFEKENAQLKDQLESLQMLWSENRKHCEALELRMQSLNQINQELSRKLKEQRLDQEAHLLDLKKESARETLAIELKDQETKLEASSDHLAAEAESLPFSTATKCAKARTSDR